MNKKERNRQYSKKYVQTHSKRVKRYQNKYRKKHKDYLRRYNREWMRIKRMGLSTKGINIKKVKMKNQPKWESQQNLKKKTFPKAKSYKDYLLKTQKLHPKETAYFRPFSSRYVETII